MTQQISSTLSAPKVAVIVTAYNMEKFVAQGIESVIQQTFQNWELLVINDGSKDNTASIVEPYCLKDSRVRLVTVENGGVCRARDMGAELSSAEYILFLDGDDFLEPNGLDLLVSALDSNPNSVGAYGLPKMIDENDEVICDDIENAFGSWREKISGDKHVKIAETEPTTLATMCIWSFVSTPGQVLIRRSAFKQTGGHFNDIPHSEDWDLWLRLCLIGDFAFIRKFVMTKRERRNSRSRHWPSMGLAEPIIRERLASKLPMSAEQRKIARTAHRYSCFFKMSWAKETLKKDGVTEGLKQIYRGCRSYLRYLKTSYDFKNVL